MQGFGKTVWTKAYGAAKPRLLLYDPKAEYPNVDYTTEPDLWVPGVLSRETKQFRYGTYQEDDIPLFGNTAYAATNCTLIMEECAMLFTKGGGVEKWARPLIYMGREPKLNLVLVSQRANNIPVGIRSQASRIVTFWQAEPDDIDSLAEKIGWQYREEIATLPRLTCLDWEEGRVTRYQVHP